MIFKCWMLCFKAKDLLETLQNLHLGSLQEKGAEQQASSNNWNSKRICPFFRTMDSDERGALIPNKRFFKRNMFI